MKPENQLALIIAYYLSKYDTDGVKKLGYSSFRQACLDIEKKIGVKATSVKNRRDEFDPVHDNQRVGWYQRPMSPSRVLIARQFEGLSEPALRSIVLDILKRDDSITEIIRNLPENQKKHGRKKKGEKRFILRGPTGKKAETIFLQKFSEGDTPFTGRLEDMRDYGQGYDFKIVSTQEETLVEIKGLDGNSGGVSFTDKEWIVATEKGMSYHLVVVSGISSNVVLAYFQNPAATFLPKRQIISTVAVRWAITSQQIQVPKAQSNG